MEGLSINPEGTYVDATVGGGGHFSRLLTHLDSKGIAVGIDRDPDAIAWCRSHLGTSRATVILEQSPFSRINDVLHSHNIREIDGLLLDLGVSSHQLAETGRGFSYMADAALDMRMDPSQPSTAGRLLASMDEEELGRVFGEFGEIRNASRMARVIVAFRKARPLDTSADLVRCLKAEYGPNLPVKVIAKVFQAIRIAVNGELDELKECLEKAAPFVKKGGRIAVISYHSLEDRIVKTFFRGPTECTCPPHLPRCQCREKVMFKRINKKIIVPSGSEIAQNPRSRSARLRIAEKIS
jgi:16S rRNA (cytosine1402-N4)-methyltransferase